MLTIHGVPLSIHTRKVIVAALEKKIPYELDLVFPYDPPPGWRDLSPTGLIPAITDGSFRVADSSVIVAYLEKKHPQPPLYPSGLHDYAHALWIEEFIDGGVARDVITVFQQRVLVPRLQGKAPDEAVVAEKIEQSLPPKLDYLEKALAGEYFAGRQFGIADLTLASSLTMYHYLGFRLDRRRHPGLAAHFARVLARPAWLTAMAAEQPFVQKMALDASFLRERTEAGAATA